jgi:DNA-binding MarR family transcriptional regulator
LHGVPSEQLLEFREALVQQKVTVEKRVSGEAWCRTRIIADANPQKDLKEFVLLAQALSMLRCFIDPVDITRWDLFVPFDQDEVPIEEIVNSNPVGEDGLSPRILQKLAMFAWSRRIDQVRITEEALQHAKEAITQRLSHFRIGEIPLIHNASLWSLLRISVAFAIATFSVQQNEVVVVLKRHVEMAERLVTELLERWAVEDYIEFAGAKPVTDLELKELTDWVKGSGIVKSILQELASRRWQGKDLAAKIGHEYSSVRRSLSELKARELVVRKSDGYDLTRKGAAVAKQVLFNKDENQGKEGLAEQRESALRLLGEMCNETDGNPTKDEYLAKLREDKIPDPESLLRFLLKSGDIYEPQYGRLRCTKL